MIITKRADELKPGDIIVKRTSPRHVVISTYRVSSGTIGIFSLELGAAPSAVFGNAPAMPATNEAPFDVEVTVSDDLINAARNWLDGVPPTITERKHVGDLVNKLSPPNPPTYEELLAALQASAKYVMIDYERLGEDDRRDADKSEKDASALINRARQAGLL